MDDNEKVFCSKIVTSQNHYKNNLYDLISIVPAQPLQINYQKKYICDFIPKTDKIYVPKSRPRVKVKTVRDIRTTFENDTYAYLTNDLNLQQNYLLKKIRDGSSRNENTRKSARKILCGDGPISRSSWQMLMNINPDDHLYPRQYALYNGKFIQVNGSYGGNKKMICGYDLATTKLTLKVKKGITKNNISNRKKGLLRNSLAIKFKPGPLGRKKYLDDSHQKYHGDIELLDLPKVGLVVQPLYGTVLEPTIMHFLSDLRGSDGTITEKWAEFAVSVLGKDVNSNARLLDNQCMTFDLKYKCDQRRILMRRDLDNSYFAPAVKNTYNTKSSITADSIILPEIKDVMNLILDAVEIHFKQDSIFADDDSLPQVVVEDSITTDIITSSKEKNKRRYCELDRLDVTVIQLPESSEKMSSLICGNAYCSLGCICESLKGTFKFKDHCGREECMFDCKCDFSKYTSLNSLDMDNNDLLPGIINIEDEINMRLAKEEQKFHQTVIVTSEKNILFKSEKRNWKSSKKYETFYKNMCLKNVNEKDKRKRKLTISLLKLNCDNIEPWCMVHHLYKCFCKGMFTTPVAHQNASEDLIPENLRVDAECSSEQIEKSTDCYGLIKQPMRKRVREDYSYNINKLKKVNSSEHNDISNSATVSKADSGNIVMHLEKRRKTRTVADLNRENVKLNTELRKSGRSMDKKYEDKSVLESCDSMDHYYSEYNGTCSRVNAYEGRKFSDGYYRNVNNKVKQMEENDKRLQTRMMDILNINPGNEKDDSNKILDKDPENTSKECEIIENSSDRRFAKIFTNTNDVTANDNSDRPKISFLPKRNVLYGSDNKLVSWLEANYKLHKKRLDQGLFKTSLEPPKVGKVAMYSWDFILNRYKEQKNLFLITNHMPYRIFMGVHTRNPFFSSCININDIRFADLHKYPQTVKNLLTYASDLKDNFCILRGLAHCWELIGSVAKLNKMDENIAEIEESSDDNSDVDLTHYSMDDQSSSDEQTSLGCTVQNNDQPASLNACPNMTKHIDEAGSSKWFVMTVENDFSEIRFFKRGFFVKYESIVKAINVARMSGKTVRLSSQKCADKNSGPQFGVYAIPNASEYCVFIGPYEMQDTLGIETIKSILDVRKSKRTRGIWINTNKIDNLKVIDNPLSFMPLDSFKNNEAVPLENHFCEENSVNREDAAVRLQQYLPSPSKETLPVIKAPVKPITLRKENVHHLATDSVLKNILVQSPHKVISINAPGFSSKLAVASNVGTEMDSLSKSFFDSNSSKELGIVSPPKLKISAVYSQKDVPKVSNKKPEGGMLILKPEEINRKLIDGNLNRDAKSNVQDEKNINENIQHSTIEYPLCQDNTDDSALPPCTLNTDVYVISDDEDSEVETVSEDHRTDHHWKDVLFQCTNVTDLGCVQGKQNSYLGLISFKVPGVLEFSKYYAKEEAFKKLNEALSALVRPSKPYDLNWKIVDSTEKNVEEVKLMDCETLNRAVNERFRETEEQSPQSYEIVVLPSNHLKTYSKKNNVSSLASTSTVTASNKKTEIPKTEGEQ